MSEPLDMGGVAKIYGRLMSAASRTAIGPCTLRYELAPTGVCVMVSLSVQSARRQVMRTVLWPHIANHPNDPLDFVARELATECQEAFT